MRELNQIYHEEIRPELLSRLSESQSLEEAGSLIRKGIQPLFHPEGDFLGDLPLANAEIARKLLSQIDESARLLQRGLKTHRVTFTPSSQASLGSLISPTAIAGGVAAILASIFSGIVLPAVGVVTGIGCAYAYCAVRRSPDDSAINHVEVDVVNINGIVEWLDDAIVSVEWALRLTTKEPQQSSLSLADYDDAIELFHDLLEEVKSTEEAIPKSLAFEIGRITKLLESHNIEVIWNSNAEAEGGADPTQWSIEKHNSLSAPVTLSPVFKMNGKPLRKGRLLLPE